MTTIVTRAGKGSPLTNNEMDTNLTNLNSYKVEQDISGNATITGDVYLTGSGKRITGDFSNATIANRVMFQTSTVNANTGVSVIPNGTGLTGAFQAYGNVDPTNSSFIDVACNGGTDARISSTITGTGTYLPMTFYTSGLERMQIDTTGAVLAKSATGGLGYGTGAGGTVTQATSKSTAVTLNKPTGQITMNNAALAANTRVIFGVNNSLVTEGDNVIATYVDDFGTVYRVEVQAVWTGYFQIGVTNITAGSLSQAVRLNFAIIKGAAA